MTKSRKFFLEAVVGLLAICLVFGIVFFLSGPTWAKKPEDVVKKSFDFLRDVDFSGLEKCYTPEAWAIVKSALPSLDDTDSIGELKKRVTQVAAIRIQDVRISGNQAEVQVVLDLGVDQEVEMFFLAKTLRGWKIK